MSMSFASRIKKEMTEGIVRAIFENAQFRVIESGIEKVFRELAHMSEEDYMKLSYPDAMRLAPDLTIMNSEQTEKHLVEVKYRRVWNKDLLLSVQDQVKLFKNIVLVSINANPPNKYDRYYSATYLRGCRMKYENDDIWVELRRGGKRPWKKLNQIEDDVDSLWWAMSPLEEIFPVLSNKDDKTEKILDDAIKALEGILIMPGQEE